MPAIPTSTDLGTDVADAIREYMNDDAGAVWTNAVLLPRINRSLAKVQRRMARSGVLTFADDYDTSLNALPGVPQGSDVLVLDNLPADFILPWRLWERRTGSTEQWCPMSMRVDGLTKRDPVDRLCEWEWIANELRFIGATQDNDVLIRYERQLPVLNAIEDPIPILDALDAIAAHAAWRLARSRGVVQLAADVKAEFEDEIKNLIALNTKPKQRTAVRRRGYSSRRIIS